MPRVLLLGAHSAIGRSLHECIDERELELELRRATLTESVEGDLEIVSEEALAWADLAVLAFSGPAALELAAAARRLGKPLLDVAEATLGLPDARWIFPGLDADAGQAFDPQRPSRIPLGLATPVIAVGRALARFEPTRMSVVTYESAAVLDQPGMDELSEQVRARFNLRDVEAKLFGGVLAFACVPRAGGKDDSPFDRDDALRTAVEAGLEASLPELEVYVTRVLVPTFSLDSAVLTVELSAPEEEIKAALAGAKGLVFDPEAAPSSIETLGRDDALCVRLSVEPERATVFLSVDRLRRGSATLACLALERWLAR